MQHFSNLSEYRTFIECLSDSSLYDETLRVLKVELDVQLNPIHTSHRQSSSVYSEWWRREKPNVYIKAYNETRSSIGKTKKWDHLDDIKSATNKR